MATVTAKALPLALVLCSCAAPQAQVPPDVLARMQSEARTEIYDRENDVAIARNRLDDNRQRARAVENRLAALDEIGKRVRLRLVKAQGAAKAALVEKPLAARRRYLLAELRRLQALGRVSEAQVAAAGARLEQTRQRELVRTGRDLSRSMARFDKAVEVLDGKVRDEERHQQDLRLDTEKAYEQWKAAEAEYAQATSDYDTAIWLE